MPGRRMSGSLLGCFAYASALQWVPYHNAAARRFKMPRALSPRMADGKIARLEASIRELEAIGCDEEVLAPLKRELNNIKLADLEDQVRALKDSLGTDQPPPPSPPSPPSSDDVVVIGGKRYLIKPPTPSAPPSPPPEPASRAFGDFAFPLRDRRRELTAEQQAAAAQASASREAQRDKDARVRAEEARVREARVAEQRAAWEAQKVEAARVAAIEAERMEKARVAQGKARRMAERSAEIEACKAEIMGSLRLPADNRRQLLRKLQVRWHPDNFPGDDPAATEAREFANVVARIANEAASKAKKDRNRQSRKKKQDEAYEALQAAMPTLLGGLVGSNNTPALRAAIELAKKEGVSRVAIRDAENALSKMESAGRPGGKRSGQERDKDK